MSSVQIQHLYYLGELTVSNHCDGCGKEEKNSDDLLYSIVHWKKRYESTGKLRKYLRIEGSLSSIKNHPVKYVYAEQDLCDNCVKEIES
jgi:hypothetical protein